MVCAVAGRAVDDRDGVTVVVAGAGEPGGRRVNRVGRIADRQDEGTGADGDEGGYLATAAGLDGVAGRGVDDGNLVCLGTDRDVDGIGRLVQYRRAWPRADCNGGRRRGAAGGVGRVARGGV